MAGRADRFSTAVSHEPPGTGLDLCRHAGFDRHNFQPEHRRRADHERRPVLPAETSLMHFPGQKPPKVFPSISRRRQSIQTSPFAPLLLYYRMRKSVLAGCAIVAVMFFLG